MEPFRLTSQTVAFIAVMAVVAVVVAVAAPFGSIALGVLALLALGTILIKAMFRARKWWPLNAVEGTIALSSLVLVSGSVGVVAYSIVRLGTDSGLPMMIGWPYVDPNRAGERTHGVSYSDSSTQQRLKDGLREAGIPFTVKTEDGKEFVNWKHEHHAAAEAISAKVRDPLAGRRNAHFPDAKLQEQFLDWLKQKAVKYEVVEMRGQEYVVWDESAGDAVRQFMESRGADCKGKVAAGKSEAGRC